MKVEEMPGQALSFVQQRFWFLHQLEPGDPAGFLSARLALIGPVDPEALRRALAEVVGRHAILRTVFLAREGHPIAVALPEIRLALPCIDPASLAPAEIEGRLCTQEQEMQRPFDLEHGPLIRVALFRRSATDHLLLLTLHRIIGDRTSVQVLAEELMARYQGEPEAADESTQTPYQDHAAAQHARRERGEFAPALAYRQRQLGESLPTLQLPTDRPRPPFQTSRVDSASLRVPDTLWMALSALAHREEVSPRAAWLAGFQILVGRCAGQEALCVGLPVTGRTGAGSAGLIGPYEDLLPLRIDLAAMPDFRRLLRHTHRQIEAMHAREEAPFDLLVETLQPERAPDRHPICQVRFRFEETAQPAEPRDRILRCGPIEIEEASKFDLTLVVRAADRGVNLTLEYNADLFERSTAERMLRRLQALMQSAVEGPDRQLTALTLLDEQERHQLLTVWNRTDREIAHEIDSKFAGEIAIPERVEAQALRTPEAIAAVLGSERITYRDLDQGANRFARYLMQHGIEAGTRVGLCLPRSFEMLMAVLGVLKIGAAYVPLDPAYPRERLEFMLEDAGLCALVTHSSLLGSLPDIPGIPRLSIDKEAPQIAQQSAAPLERLPSDDRSIYLTYTSGSTGKPKGIEMTQRPLDNLLRWMLRTTRLPEGARTLQFASLSFDVSFQDIFSTLASGGALVLISEDQRRDIGGLWKILVEQRVHRIFLPAVALQQLAEGFRPELHRAASLRKVISGSEQLLVTQAILTLFRHLPECRLHNEYGPSETHVVTEFALPAAPDEWPIRPAIGRPIDNTRIYLLDPSGQPVPIGTTGELYIGGLGLARGYRCRPEANAERFLPDSFSDRPGARLYRTGDRARYLANGSLEFLGRLDHQVKVRGYRIEPAEIEAALERHPAVREAAVVALECGTPHAYLAAYLVTDNVTDKDQDRSQDSSRERSREGGRSLNVSDLRAFLAERLPDYLIPSAFVLLDRLPLNANGKVDRQALPLPDRQRPEMSSTYTPPADLMEATILAVWRTALGVEQIGMNDSFFDLGGHSLRVVQAAELLREALGREIAIVSLFRYITIRALARHLGDEAKPESSLRAVHSRAQLQKAALAKRAERSFKD